MNLDAFGNEQLGGGTGAGGATRSAASASSGLQFGGFSDGDGNKLGIIIAALLAFLVLVVVAKK